MLRPPGGGGAAERYAPLATLIVGTSVGGAFLGILVGGLSFLVSGQGNLGPGILPGLALLSLFGIFAPSVRRWIPERTCQVASRRMLMNSLTQAAFQWGIVLGLGVCTFIVTPALYGFLAVAANQADPLAAFALCLLYGFVRGVVIAGFALTEPQLQARRAERQMGLLEKRLRAPLALAVVLATVLTLLAL